MITRDGNSTTENGRNNRTPDSGKPLDLSEIKALVQRFRVCWEVHPEQALASVVDPKQAHGNCPKPRWTPVNTELRKIGFSLELYGTPEPGTEHVSPGCNHCRRVQAALKETADWILPRERRPCMYDIETDIQSLSYSRARAERPDVRVTIHILHLNGWDQPVDEYQERCVKDMEHTLRELGACNGAWSPLSGESRA